VAGGVRRNPSDHGRGGLDDIGYHDASQRRTAAPGGRPVAIAEYLGSSDMFDQSATDFSERYADQNEKDHEESLTVGRAGASKGSGESTIGPVHRHYQTQLGPDARSIRSNMP